MSDKTGGALKLLRWNVSTGSAVKARATVIIGSGGHAWEASAVGDGPVDALFRAIDRALHPVLSGHPRLIAYSVKALPALNGHPASSDAEGLVEVRLSPPDDDVQFSGSATDPNILAASVAAYLTAINLLLASPGYEAAIEAAGNRRRAAYPVPAQAILDPDAPDHNMTGWYQD